MCVGMCRWEQQTCVDGLVTQFRMKEEERRPPEQDRLQRTCIDRSKGMRGWGGGGAGGGRSCKTLKPVGLS